MEANGSAGGDRRIGTRCGQRRLGRHPIGVFGNARGHGVNLDVRAVLLPNRRGHHLGRAVHVCSVAQDRGHQPSGQRAGIADLHHGGRHAHKGRRVESMLGRGTRRRKWTYNPRGYPAGRPRALTPLAAVDASGEPGKRPGHRRDDRLATARWARRSRHPVCNARWMSYPNGPAHRSSSLSGSGLHWRLRIKERRAISTTPASEVSTTGRPQPQPRPGRVNLGRLDERAQWSAGDDRALASSQVGPECALDSSHFRRDRSAEISRASVRSCCGFGGPAARDLGRGQGCCPPGRWTTHG